MVGCSGARQARVEGTLSAVVSAVERRVGAFNRHALSDYLQAHTPQVQIYEYPDRLLGTGRSHLRKIFGPAIEAKDCRIDVQRRIEFGQVVVSDEVLTIGNRDERLIAIYTVVDGKIGEIRLIEEDSIGLAAACGESCRSRISEWLR